MSATNTIRIRHRASFVVIANDIAQDNALSLKARGLFLYLFSLPDGWQTSVEALAGQVPESREAVRKAVHELEAAGYLIRRRWKGDRGHFQHEWVLQESPLSPPVVERSPDPLDGFPSGGEAAAGNPSNIREYEVQRTQDKELTPPVVPPATEPPPERADVWRVCDALADAIEGNGSRRPNITKRWLADARLMIDKDGRSEVEVLGAIRWSQTDSFWRANILSMAALRKQFDRMRLQAQRPALRGNDKLAPIDRGLALLQGRALAEGAVPALPEGSQ